MLWRIERGLLRCCNMTAQFFPRISVNLLVLWGFYTTLANIGLVRPVVAVLVTAPALVFWALGIYSYNSVWYMGPGSPFEISELHSDTPPECIRLGAMAKRDGGYRYCQKCQLWKPDRAHHCSSCNACRLKMDHHCPWFSTCIGFKNHKLFIQSLWYIAVFCVLGSIMATLLVFDFFGASRYKTEFIDVNLLMFMIMSAVLGLAVAAFAGYTTWLAAENTTTIESLEKGATIWRTSLPYSQFRYREPPTMYTLGNLWDVGTIPNLNQILGSTWPEWLLPIEARLPHHIDGVLWPVNQELQEQAESRAQTECELLARHYR